jgi:hypothetical protein
MMAEPENKIPWWGMGIDHSLPHSNWSRSLVAGDHFHGSIRRAGVGNIATPQKQSCRIVNGTPITAIA